MAETEPATSDVRRLDSPVRGCRGVGMRRKVADSKDRGHWLAERRKLITASDVAAVMGKNPYCSAKEVFNRKISGIEQEPNADMQRGVELESIILRTFGQKIRRPCRQLTGLWVNDEFPWLGATLDGMCILSKHHIVEIKAPRKLPDLPRPYHLIQINCQMMVSGIDQGVLVYGVQPGKIRDFWLQADPKLQHDIFVKSKQFHGYLQSGYLPPDMW